MVSQREGLFNVDTDSTLQPNTGTKTFTPMEGVIQSKLKITALFPQPQRLPSRVSQTNSCLFDESEM
jgi:hypothetical protein